MPGSRPTLMSIAGAKIGNGRGYNATNRQGDLMVTDRHVPDGWREVRLEDVAEVVGGSTPPRVKEEFWGGDVPWAVPSELTKLEGRYLTATKESVTDAGMKSAGLRLVPAGSVLLTSRATIGVAAINSMPVVTNQGFQNLVGKNGIDPLWLFYCILSMRPELARRASGSTFLEVSRGSVRSIPILLPPLSEQRAIAAVLDSIDEAIERTEAVIAATERLRESLLHELLTRGVPGWHTEWKEVRGLGTIPAGWEVVRLGDRIEEGPTNGIYKPESEYGSGTWLIRIDDFAPGALLRLNGFNRIRISEQELYHYGIRKGDILINRVNSLSHIGKSVLMPKLGETAVFESNMMKLRMRRDIHPEFVALVLLSKASRRYFVSRAKKVVQQASINQQDVSQLPLPLPTRREQAIIAEVAIALRDWIGRNRKALLKLKALKTSVADALLTGRLRVSP